MGILAQTMPTLLELVNSLNPDGSEAEIAEVLTQHTEVLDDMTWMNGNKTTGHIDSYRTVLPEPQYRAINEGVGYSKGASAQMEESTAMLEDWSKCDRELALLSGNVEAYRLKEAHPHLIGFAHKMARDVFYGNANVDPKAFTGLAPRYWTLDKAKSATAENVIDADGTGTGLRSIWVVGWGHHTITGLVPKNSVGGLQHEDMTNDPKGTKLYDDQGRPYVGYEDHWTWRCGMFVKDWRYAVRVANIDVDLLTKDASSGPDLIYYLTEAVERIEGTAGVKAAIYVPRTIRTWLRHQTKNAKNVMLSLDQVAGKEVLNWDGIPIRRTDALNVEETEVVA